jgi:predicted TIM-barrel fold metal-dependent hydrolase
VTANIIDSHAHVIDFDRFPLVPDGRGYKPKPHEAGPREAYTAVLDAHQASGALLVQPSGYGFDNSCMLDAIAAYPGRFRGIAVVDPAIADRDLEALGARGVVGVRFNLLTYDPEGLAASEAFRLLERLRERGWLAQVYADDSQWPAAADTLRRSGVQAIVDHFGVKAVEGGLAQPGFQAVLALGRTGRAAVKLSAPFRITGDHAALKPFTDALIAAFGQENCVWGSDWPFIGLDRKIRYDAALATLSEIVPDAAVRQAILCQNPRRLFGFAI